MADSQDEHGSTEEDTDLSATECYYYNIYAKNPKSKALLISKEVHFQGLQLYPEEVVEMLKLIVSLHPIAHTGFETVKNKASSAQVVKRTILKIKHALDCYVVLNLENKTTFYEMSIKTFDLGTTAPVKFEFTIQPHLIIRFLFHRIGFDYKAVEIFVRDFTAIIKKLAVNPTIPSFTCAHSRQAYKDMDRYLKSNYAPLAEFWSKKLSRGIAKTSFSDKKLRMKAQGELFHTAYISFTSFTSRKILEMTIHTKTTMLSLIVSVYQLMLSFYSGTNAVTVVTETDLRKSISGADNIVESMTNTVPLTSPIPKKDTPLEKFLFENEARVDEYLSMAAFPFYDICKMLKKSDRKNVNKHRVVERNPEVNKESAIYECEAKEVGMLHETSLEFIYDVDRTILNLRLQASVDVYSSKDTNDILQNMAKMLRLISGNSEIGIFQLKDHILNNKHFIDLYDIFYKAEHGIPKHKVTLSLTHGEEQSHSHLQWTVIGQKVIHSVTFNTISNIHLIRDQESRGLWIKTKNGDEHTFYFINDLHIKDWIQRLELILNFSITQV